MTEVRPIVLASGEGEALDLRGAQMRIKVGALTAGAGFSLIESQDPTGFAAAPHIHHEAAEAFYVLEGEYVLQCGEEETVILPGGFAFVPSGVSHGYRLVSAQGRILILFAPAGIERFWQELGRQLAAGTLTPEIRSKLARDMIATEFL
ncbi:MAG: cupin domain-containing protein [Candidatus Limnocylindria bacterium]